MTFRSLVLVLLMFTVSEVKCGDVTFMIEKKHQIIDNNKTINISFYITHGTNPTTKNRIWQNFFASKFVCLYQNQTIKLELTDAKPESFKVIVKKSFDFGTYEDHNPDYRIPNFIKNDSVLCFFTGSFKKNLDTTQDKAELYIRFFTDKKYFPYQRILIMNIFLEENYIFTHLTTIEKHYSYQEVKDDDYVLKELSYKKIDRKEDMKNIKVNLNGDNFELDGIGTFKVFFTHPNYLPEFNDPNIYYGKDKNPQGKLEITFVDNVVNIMFPNPVNTGKVQQKII